MYYSPTPLTPFPPPPSPKLLTPYVPPLQTSLSGLSAGGAERRSIAGPAPDLSWCEAFEGRAAELLALLLEAEAALAGLPNVDAMPLDGPQEGKDEGQEEGQVTGGRAAGRRLGAPELRRRLSVVQGHADQLVKLRETGAKGRCIVPLYHLPTDHQPPTHQPPTTYPPPPTTNHPHRQKPTADRTAPLPLPRSFVWVDGPLVRAMLNGHWLLLDNANLCNPSVRQEP